ncbi:MAG: Flp pilus assembly protein CpaB [Rhodospirillales bacterium]|nr:Flp pilus assembly protein CpaB [Rhodospirillales bacterium]
MKVLIVGILVLALAVAGVSTYLIQRFGGEENLEELQKQAQKPKVRVLVATRDLAPGEPLTPETMTWQVWVDESLNKQFIVVEKDDQEAKRIKDFVGGIVRAPILEGEPILASKVFKSDKPGFLAGVLKAGMRAVSFTVSATSATAGFILPGDRVDILLTHDKLNQALRKKRGAGSGGEGGVRVPSMMVLAQVTETIMKDLNVLAVNSVVALKEGTTIKASTITLELTPKQAEMMVTARTMGKISMVLRSLEKGPAAGSVSDKPSFSTDVEVSPILSNFDAVIEAENNKNDKKMKKGKKVADKAPVVKASVVKIFRGGSSSTEEIRYDSAGKSTSTTSGGVAVAPPSAEGASEKLSPKTAEGKK